MKTPTITLTRKGPEEDGWKLFINGICLAADWCTWAEIARNATSHKYQLPWEYWIADGSGNYGYLKP